MVRSKPRDPPPIAATVDIVVLTIRDDELQVLTVTRGSDPYRGRRALPGGFVREDEDLRSAALRELREETGLRRAAHLEQLATYGEPGRDPRMRVVSVAYLVLAADVPPPRGGSDAAAASFVPVREALRRGRLAFDHRTILGDGLERLRAELACSPVATSFIRAPFTVGELRRVYEIVWGTAIDPRNFHRKVTGVDGLLVETGETTTRGGGRPAMLYRVGPARALNPPLLRPVAD